MERKAKIDAERKRILAIYNREQEELRWKREKELEGQPFPFNDFSVSEPWKNYLKNMKPEDDPYRLFYNDDLQAARLKRA